MTADSDAYDYFLKKGVVVFSKKDAFDGIHGMMVYNRTLQRSGKSHKYNPINEWIVSVGEHEGVISGATWVMVQNMLEINKSKGYRKPKSNTAMLSGLLRCGKCGDYMRPKLTKRLDASGNPVYTYLCTTKERSTSRVCNIKNAPGRSIDECVTDVIRNFLVPCRELSEMILCLKSRISRGSDPYEEEKTRLSALLSENEKTMRTLARTLGQSDAEHARQYIMEEIESIHEKSTEIKKQLTVLEKRLSSAYLSDDEFENCVRCMSSVKEIFAFYDIKQKRAFAKALIKEVVWDTENVHIYLMYSDEEGASEYSDNESAECKVLKEK